jgi:hypothetical protein
LLVVIYFASKLVGDCALCNPVGTVVMMALYQCFTGAGLGFIRLLGSIFFYGSCLNLYYTCLIEACCLCLLVQVCILVVGLLFVMVFIVSDKLIDVPVNPFSCPSPLGGLLCCWVAFLVWCIPLPGTIL